MIGVIADDLTGAAELGAAGLRRGLRAEVVMGGRAGTEAQLVCFDTDSRFCGSAEAGRQAASAAGLLVESGANWIYKKVDSVLRGQVVAELEAIMRQLGLDLALLVPANPSLGRVIQEGQYFVGGRPIHETEFARDPWYPRASSGVVDLLGAAQTLPIRVCKVTDPLPHAGIVVGEVGSGADLRHWASFLKQRLLLAGGAEFFGALLEAAGHAPMTLPAPAMRAELGRELFVSGSTSDSAREFVRSARAGGWPVFSLPPSVVQGVDFTPALMDAVAQPAIAAFSSHRRVILNVGLPLVQEAEIARRLSGYLAEAAAKVMRLAKVGHVYAEGGATAIELARRMGWSRLQVLGELAPGVAKLGPAGEVSVAFTIKPGSYLWPQFKEFS